MRWPLQPLQPFQQTQLQPPFGQSVDSLCHPWFTTTNVSYRFPILKLPPPPCAVLLVLFFNYSICCAHTDHGKHEGLGRCLSCIGERHRQGWSVLEILSEIHSDVTAARCTPLHGEGMGMAFRLCCVHSPFPKDLSGFSSSCSESTQAFWINMAHFETSYKVVSWYMYWPRASYVDKVALAVHAARVECVSGHACSLKRIWGAMLPLTALFCPTQTDPRCKIVRDKARNHWQC